MHLAVSGAALSVAVLSASSVLAQTVGQLPAQSPPSASYGYQPPTAGTPAPQQQYGNPPYGTQGYGTQPAYGSQPAYGAQPAAAQPGLQAGGLTAPAPVTEDPAAVQTEQSLDDADKKDSGRGLEFFYLNAELGFETLGLDTLHANKIVDAGTVHTSNTGFLWGAGLGLRLLFFTAGARFRMASFSDYDVWTLDAELGLHIPIGRVEPYLQLAAGYASLSGLSDSSVNTNSVDVHGYNVRAGGGLDVYVTPVFSVGVNVTGDLLGLTRPGVSLSQVEKATSTGTPTTTQQANQDKAQLYAASGSSIGLGINGTFVVGLHF
jgi:hypothetical protein